MSIRWENITRDFAQSFVNGDWRKYLIEQILNELPLELCDEHVSHNTFMQSPSPFQEGTDENTQIQEWKRGYVMEDMPGSDFCFDKSVAIGPGSYGVRFETVLVSESGDDGEVLGQALFIQRGEDGEFFVAVHDCKERTLDIYADIAKFKIRDVANTEQLTAAFDYDEDSEDVHPIEFLVDAIRTISTLLPGYPGAVYVLVEQEPDKGRGVVTEVYHRKNKALQAAIRDNFGCWLSNAETLWETDKEKAEQVLPTYIVSQMEHCYRMGDYSGVQSLKLENGDDNDEQLLETIHEYFVSCLKEGGEYYTTVDTAGYFF